MLAQTSLLQRRRELYGRLLAMKLLFIPTPRLVNFSLLRSWLRAVAKEGPARSVPCGAPRAADGGGDALCFRHSLLSSEHGSLDHHRKLELDRLP